MCIAGTINHDYVYWGEEIWRYMDMKIHMATISQFLLRSGILFKNNMYFHWTESTKWIQQTTVPWIVQNFNVTYIFICDFKHNLYTEIIIQRRHNELIFAFFINHALSNIGFDYTFITQT